MRGEIRSSQEGGLGIRNLEIFNLVLLGKWGWKIKIERNGLWYRALLNKYGINREFIRVENIGVSVWWKEICNLDYGGVESYNVYSAKEVYKWLMSNMSSSSDPIWSKAWHKSVPLKVSCLVWRLFQNRLATRYNLAKRGVMDQSTIQCVGDCRSEESVTHLFFECSVFSSVWFGVCQWFRISAAFQKEGRLYLEQFGG